MTSVNQCKKTGIVALRLFFLFRMTFDLRLRKQVMADTPGVTALPSEQLTASHVEYLPSIEPHGSLVLSVRLFQVWPYLLLARRHFGNPVLSDDQSCPICPVIGRRLNS